MAIGFVLRIVWLDKYPAGFTPDEAAFGYNAYSILQTGKDEWGTPWWQLFVSNMRSFGDYKLPLYTFLAIPSVKLFGLTEFATRLPNAIVGTLAIGAIYLLTKKLFARDAVGLTASFILTVSPWAISMSRGAFEANLATLFLPLGIYCFLQNKYWLSALVFAASFYSYHSARFVMPFIILALVFFYKKINKNLLLPGIFLGILLIPGLMSMVSRGSARTTDVSIISPTGGWGAVADRRFEAVIVGLPDAVSRLFSNKPIYVLSSFVKNYLSYWSPQFWFTNGAGESTYGMIAGRGVFYYVEILFLVGFLMIFIRHPKKEYFLILLFAALSFLPASLAKGPGLAANRAVIALPFLVVMLSTGAEYILKKKFVFILISISYLLSTIYFLEDYLYHAPKTMAPSMTYGWKELMPRLLPIASRFEEVRVSRSLSEPHIFTAFYSQTDPKVYQKFSPRWLKFEDMNLKFLDQLDGYQLEKYRFGDLKFRESVQKPTLYVGRPEDFPEHQPNYITIFYPDGKPAILVTEKLP